MKKYELTVLIRAGLTHEAKDKFVQKIEKIVKVTGGVAVKMTEMGKKQLTYKIGGLAEADFLSWALELPPSSVVQLDRKLTVDGEIIRHLLVKSES